MCAEMRVVDQTVIHSKVGRASKVAPRAVNGEITLTELIFQILALCNKVLWEKDEFVRAESGVVGGAIYAEVV